MDRPNMDVSEMRLAILLGTEPVQCPPMTAPDGWRLLVVSDADGALAMLDTRPPMNIRAIVLDQSTTGDATCQLIAKLKRHCPALPIVILVSPMLPVLAVAALRAGATDYLVKPVLPGRLAQALHWTILPETGADGRHTALQLLSQKLPANSDFGVMIGASPDFRMALAIAAQAARRRGPVLIEGECGAGKDMLARAMHAAGMRAKLPLHVVDLRVTSPNAIESRLFGHEQGAFPGAFDRQLGAIQQSDGGTLLLDRIECLPETIQHRLLEAMRRGICRPVGAQHSFRVDVRYIFSAGSNLKEQARKGRFLPELYHAISAVTLTLPPLRERSGDIAALARHFLSLIGKQPGLRSLGITDGALMQLAAYDWPGNVRQLQAVLFRAAVFCHGDALTSDDFPQLIERVDQKMSVGGHCRENTAVTLFAPDGNLRPLGDIEADVIRLAIGHYRGRMTEVARRLGIGRSTLYRKLVVLGIDNAA